MEQARTRLVTACAEIGTTEAVRSIVAKAFGPGSEGLFTGIRTPEPRPSLTEQLDAMCARVQARAQEVAA
jgi:hypothetical protein